MSIKVLFYVVFLPIFLILGLGFAAMLLLGVQFEASFYNKQACRAQANSLKHMICSQWTAGLRQGGFEARDQERMRVALERVRQQTDAHGIWIYDGQHALVAESGPLLEEIDPELQPVQFAHEENPDAECQELIINDHHVLRIARPLVVEQFGKPVRLGTLVLDFSVDQDVRQNLLLEQYLLIAAAVVTLLGLLVITYLSSVFSRESKALRLAADENMPVEEVASSEVTSNIREIDDLVKTIGILKDVRMDVKRRAAREEVDRVRSL